jgi:lipopolysaccharide export system protein LptA
MRSAALVLIALVALGTAVAPLAAQTKAPTPAPKSGGTAPAPAAPAPAPAAKPAAKSGDKGSGPRSNAPIVIDADRMEAFKKDGLVVFSGNVIAKQENSVQTADRMEVYLDDKGERVLRIISTGNVKIVTEDCRTGTAKRAEYYDDDQKLLLIGDAKVWQEDNVVTGERMVMYLADDRSEAESGPQGRVKSVFYPKRDEDKQSGGAPAAKKDEKRAGGCG